MFIRFQCESQWPFCIGFIQLHFSLYCHCISTLLKYHQTQHFLLFTLSTEHVLTSPWWLPGFSSACKAVESYMTDYTDIFVSLTDYPVIFVRILLSTFQIVGNYYIICINLLNVLMHDCSIYYLIALYSNIYWCYSSLYLFSCI